MAHTLLARLRRGTPESVSRVTLDVGTQLVATYDADGDLVELGVAAGDAAPTGARLYFDWLNDLHAWKTPSGLSGQQWSDGQVISGTVYDDAGGAPGREVSIDDWIDECVEAMRRAALA